MGLFTALKKIKEKSDEEKMIYEDFKNIYSEWKSYGRKIVDAEDYYNEGIQAMNSLHQIDPEYFNRTVSSESKKNNIYTEHPVFGLFFNNNNKYSSIENNIQEKNSFLENVIKVSKANVEKLNSIPKYKISINKDYVLERKSLEEMQELKFAPVTKSFNSGAKLPAFVVIDTETTGLYANTDRIVELSAIKYVDFQPTESFTTYINPEKAISPKATQVNGITAETVKDAPLISEVSESFIAFIGNLPVVGYNVGFDLKFLFASGIDILGKRKIYDAYELSKKAYKDLSSYSLQSVTQEEHIYMPLHDSLCDCFATEKVFDNAIKTIVNR